MALHEIIAQFYPEYHNIMHYPADKVAGITKVNAPWGILGNFAQAPIVVDGVSFPTSEHLFHIMKFTDSEVRKDILGLGGMPLKWASKKYEKEGYRRQDWGSIIVDAMKYCLVKKYEQNEMFRKELERSRGLFILEDETSRKKGKAADSWGAVKSADGTEYVGPNLLGRLMMELRDSDGHLEFNLPAGICDFSDLRYPKVNP